MNERIENVLSKRFEWEADHSNVELAQEWVRLENELTDSEFMRYIRFYPFYLERKRASL